MSEVFNTKTRPPSLTRISFWNYQQPLPRPVHRVTETLQSEIQGNLDMAMSTTMRVCRSLDKLHRPNDPVEAVPHTCIKKGATASESQQSSTEEVECLADLFVTIIGQAVSQKCQPVGGNKARSLSLFPHAGLLGRIW